MNQQQAKQVISRMNQKGSRLSRTVKNSPAGKKECCVFSYQGEKWRTMIDSGVVRSIQHIDSEQYIFGGRG